MQDWIDKELIEVRQQEMLRRAERQRLITKYRESGYIDHILNHFGELLITWGVNLQQRYGAIAESPITHPEWHCTKHAKVKYGTVDSC